jgi:hypothetical protein
MLDWLYCRKRKIVHVAGHCRLIGKDDHLALAAGDLDSAHTECDARGLEVDKDFFKRLQGEVP